MLTDEPNKIPNRVFDPSCTFSDPASHVAHHQPSNDHVAIVRHPPPWLAFHSSRTVWNGFQRLAIGMNHQPTAQPGVNRNPPADRPPAFACAWCCQMHHTITVARNARPPSAEVPDTQPSTRSSCCCVTRPVACSVRS